MKIKLDKKLIAVYGPTISEKTGLAVNLAKYIWGKYNLEVELITADPRKIYQELTVVPVPIYPPYDQKIKIHLFGTIKSLKQKFTLYEYKNKVDKIIKKIHRQKHLPLIYGGGSVWLSAVLENWNVPPKAKNNTDFKKEFGREKPLYQAIIFIPKISRQSLAKKIKAHTLKNIKGGLIDELIKLTKKYQINPLSPPTDHLLYKTLEYRQFLEYCHQNQKELEDLNKEDLKEIQKESTKALLNYARYQMNWIPKMKGEKHFVYSWKEARKIVDQFLLR